MKKTKSILITDGCPLICEAYKSIINTIKKKESYSYNINTIHCCEGSYEIIDKTIKNKTSLDIIILELNFSQKYYNNYFIGEDLALKVRTELPDTKIIISTTSNDNFRIHNIFKTINPEGFILKEDLTSKEFRRAFLSIINNEPFYSKSILKLIRKEVSSNLVIDNIDRKILYELSIGAKMKDMPNFIPLSVASIEKRKRQLKKVFNVKDKGDRELILIAKEKGLI